MDTAQCPTLSQPTRVGRKSGLPLTNRRVGLPGTRASDLHIVSAAVPGGKAHLEGGCPSDPGAQPSLLEPQLLAQTPQTCHPCPQLPLSAFSSALWVSVMTPAAS